MTQMFDQNDQIRFTETGSGPTVVLLHGSASSAKQWDSMREYLSGKFRVICPDLPGYGRSTNVSDDLALNLEEIVECLAPVFDRCDEPLHLVGHSFGGVVALKAAGMLPGKIESLTLIEPVAFNVIWSKHGVNTPETSRFVQTARTSQIFMEEGDAWNATRAFIDFWCGDGAWDRTNFGLCQKLAMHAGQLQKDLAALIMDQTTDMDLAGVVCPVLTITGSESPSEMKEVLSALSRSVPFIRQEIISDAGHMLPLTDPHIVDPMVGDFLEQVDRRGQDRKVHLQFAA